MTITGAGDRSQRINLLEPQLITGDGGVTSRTYKEVWQCWASVKTLTAREIIANNQTTSVTNYIIRILYRTDIKTDWLIEYREKQLAIETILDIGEMHQELEIIATTVEVIS